MPINLRRAFGTDTALEQDGAWVDLGSGARIRVARFNNARHRALRERLLRPHRGLLLAGRDLPADVEDRIAIDCLAETILIDWDQIEGDDGRPLPFSVDAARALLAELRDFRDAVAWHAMQAETFRQAEVEIIAKN